MKKKKNPEKPDNENDIDRSTATTDEKMTKMNGNDKNILPKRSRKRMMKIDPDDNDIKSKTQKIVLIKSDDSKEKKKKEKTFNVQRHA